MIEEMQKILVLPRKAFEGLEGFVAWSHAEKLLNFASFDVCWLPRPEAEESEQLVQPIPCAIFRDSDGRYCVFRQARQSRADLSRRLSLIVGGHVDCDSNTDSLIEIFANTVEREISEELRITEKYQLTLLGVVIDSSSLMASRHVGIVYEAEVDHDFKTVSHEEFVVRSDYNGRFFDLQSLSKLVIYQRPRLMLDPWSFILFSQYLDSDLSRDLGFQPMLHLPKE